MKITMLKALGILGTIIGIATWLNNSGNLLDYVILILMVALIREIMPIGNILKGRRATEA